MSFFGFDSALPRDRQHNSKAPGFGQAPDPFAGLSRAVAGDDDDVLDFEDTYDGLGDQLDEADDAFNADTFGSATTNLQRGSGRPDFDFAGQTAKMADTLDEEHMLFAARRPQRQPSPPRNVAKPSRTGYENYAQPEYIPQLEANASLWGMQPRQPAPQQPVSQEPKAQPRKHMMSLDEVEAMMLVQTQQPPQPTSQINMPPPTAQLQQPTYSLQILQRQQQPQQQQQQQQFQQPRENQYPQPRFQPSNEPQAPQILQRPQPPQATPSPQPPSQLNNAPGPLHQPRQILQNPNRNSQTIPGHAAQPSIELQRGQAGGVMHGRGPSIGQSVRDQQLLHLSEEERAAYLQEEAKRAKRNYKIQQLSKSNGLMTPQDKNFITRIQLQQLVTATGGADDRDPEAPLAEDFYYQVYSQIRGAPRQNPNQPLNHFAQTYLHQTGGRAGSRRYPRGGDSHMRRMEQQVQRAVEAAKLKPKNKQLILEGSLGKISFSNAKTPKPLLNLKLQQNGQNGSPSVGRARPSVTVEGRKAVLRNIENIYTALMKMEDHERRIPPPPTEESSADVIEESMNWRKKLQVLNDALWDALKIQEPIVPNSPTPHPFIAILSHPKGKKVIARVFRQIDDQQRLTIFTMIIVHLDTLDVIRQAYLYQDEVKLPPAVRDEVELFSQAVMPSLFAYISDAPLVTVVGLLALVMDRANVRVVIRTKIGVGLLTMFISRAELIKQGTQASEADLAEWNGVYDSLFDAIEPELVHVFPGPINAAEDTYAWQFLAAMGIGASPDQQQRLVIAVKDRVMDTVTQAKTLPPDMSKQRLGNVNLFMRAIGLDVELLG